MDSITFLERLPKAKPQPVYVLHGEEAFLKRQVQQGIRTLVLGPDDDGFALARYQGDRADWATVIGELQTLPFLAKRRLVVIDNADPFVTQYRARLEKLFSELREQASPSGVLVLDVKTWASNTKLAKMAPDTWAVSCGSPSSAQLPAWCVQWCQSHHGKQLASGAARLLVDLVGSEMGLLDQELAKLAVYVGPAPRIEASDVDEIVGRRRADVVWKLLDFIAAAQSKEALALLGQLFDQGEDPVGLLAALGFSLRKLAQAYRLNSQGVPIQDAMKRAGVRAHPAAAEQQMKHLGRRRLGRIYDWVLETDMGMKGGSALHPRIQLERLVVRLARPRS